VEDLLFSASELSGSPVVMAVDVAIKDNQKVVGVCFTDASSSRVLGVAEFMDNEAFSNFESLLIQQNIKECILPEDNCYEMQQIRKVVQRCGVVDTAVRKARFQSKNVVQDLTRLLDSDVNVQSLPAVSLSVAMAATACIISYLDLLQDESSLGYYHLEQFDLSQYMRLDASAVQALNLNAGPKDGNKFMNLLGLLNRCKTAQGTRLLGQWIKQPLMNVPEIRKRQDLVQLFAQDVSLRHMVQETCLKSFPDLHRLAKKFQRGKANLQDVVRVYQVIRSLPALSGSLIEYNGEFQELLEEVFTSKLKVHRT
jgi:DNA mismatch repair protein MSH2